jgi:transcriptional regulator with XRE-family HTH domain
MQVGGSVSWFEPDDEDRRLTAHERLLLEATEAVSKALDDRGMSRRQFAQALGVRPSEITQRLSGARNLTLRTLAEMLDALNCDVHLSVVERSSKGAYEPA